MTIEALEDVLSDIMGGIVIDPQRQGKRTDGGFFGPRPKPQKLEEKQSK